MTLGGEHTVKSYDKDLTSLSSTLESMLNLVGESLDFISETLSTFDNKILEKIIAHDYKINSLDCLIEKKVTAILAMRQPMAVDLRYVVSSLKVSSNLERIGDQAKGIIKKFLKMQSIELDEKIKDSLLKMLTLSKIMLNSTIKAFNDQNVEEANKILAQDDEVDKIYANLFKIIDADNFNRKEMQNIINVLFIAKSFERLADHTTNIAEITKYVVTGETK